MGKTQLVNVMPIPPYITLLSFVEVDQVIVAMCTPMIPAHQDS
jgi:hypothetical protein